MKKIIFLFTIICTLNSFSQNIELTPIFGYTFSGSSNYYNNFELDIKDDISYGAMISAEMAPQMHIEFMYQTTEAGMRVRDFGDVTNYNVRYEHFQLGVLHEFDSGDLIPFLKASLGTTHYKVKTNSTYNDGDSWEFSGSIGGGVKKFFSDNIGIRLQTNLILPMRWSGGGVYCGPYGCSGGTSFHVPLVHWEVSAGLILKLDKKESSIN
jgi:hypothetical protein